MTSTSQRDSNKENLPAGLIRGRFVSRKPAVGLASTSPLPWLSILLAFASAFYLYPAVEVIRFALTNSSLLRDRYRYTFDTIEDIATSRVVHDSLQITLFYIVIGVSLQFIFGLVAAIALDRGTERNLMGTTFVRSVVLVAWILPGVVIGVVWRFVLSEADYGLVNSVLEALGFTPVAFLSDRAIALWTLIIAGAWRGTAFTMILLFAGLQSIDPMLYEAAKVDGASAIQIFRHITLPQLRPIISINLILATIGAMNTFDMVLSLTAGGPGRATEVLSLLTYNRLFIDFDLSEASVLAVMMLTLSLLFTIFYMYYLQRDVD